MLNLKRPALLVDKSKALRNIAAMVKNAGSHGVRLSPHFKTHQSREIAKWIRNAGIRSATVSSVTMAQYFAGDGWDDITIAIPETRIKPDHWKRSRPYIPGPWMGSIP